jgi:hypothetical protein
MWLLLDFRTQFAHSGIPVMFADAHLQSVKDAMMRPEIAAIPSKR